MTVFRRRENSCTATTVSVCIFLYWIKKIIRIGRSGCVNVTKLVVWIIVAPPYLTDALNPDPIVSTYSLFGYGKIYPPQYNLNYQISQNFHGEICWRFSDMNIPVKHFECSIFPKKYDLAISFHTILYLIFFEVFLIKFCFPQNCLRRIEPWLTK